MLDTNTLLLYNSEVKDPEFESVSVSFSAFFLWAAVTSESQKINIHRFQISADTI